MCAPTYEPTSQPARLAQYRVSLIYNPPNPANGDAQIGAVKVAGDWIASNLVAGVSNVAAGNTQFGDSNDASIGAGDPGITARIATIVIGDQVQGTVGGADHFGFVAQQIGSIRIAGMLIPLTAGAGNDNRALGATGDVNLHEV